MRAVSVSVGVALCLLLACVAIAGVDASASATVQSRSGADAVAFVLQPARPAPVSKAPSPRLPSPPRSPSSPRSAPKGKFAAVARQVIKVQKVFKSLKLGTTSRTRSQAEIAQLIAKSKAVSPKRPATAAPTTRSAAAARPRALVELHSGAESESASQSELHAEAEAEATTALAWTTPTLPFSNAADLRKQIRDNKADTNPLNGFTYTLYSDGTVQKAVGDVVIQGKRTDPDTGAVHFCDAIYQQQEGKVRDRTLYHSGHIIASQVGGSGDALNFFPQHKKSNSGNGVYWRMERIAAGVQAAANTNSIACKVQVENVLDYTGSTWVPSKGNYFIDVDKVCRDSLNGLKSSLGAYARAFVDNADVVQGVFGTSKSGYRLESAWVNKEDTADRDDTPWLYPD